MPIFIAPMHIDGPIPDCIQRDSLSKAGTSFRGLVLTELIIVIIILSLMAGLATFSFPGVVSRKKFEKQAMDFINILKMAQNAASESDKRYAVALDFEEQTYTLKQFSRPFVEAIEEEPILFKGNFTEECFLDYVFFDDGFDSREPIEGEVTFGVTFYAGRTGWQNGGMIVLLDVDGNPYSIIINRLSRVIILQPGEEHEFILPKESYEIPF